MPSSMRMRRSEKKRLYQHKKEEKHVRSGVGLPSWTRAQGAGGKRQHSFYISFSFKQVPARQGQPTAPGNKKDKEEQLWQ